MFEFTLGKLPGQVLKVYYIILSHVKSKSVGFSKKSVKILNNSQKVLHW